MRLFNRNPHSELETRLRADRPEPGSSLVHAIVARAGRATEAARPRSLRLAFGVATVGALTALGALGGVGYAASSVEHAASAVKSVFVGKPAKGEAKGASPFNTAGAAGSAIPSKTAAGDQYGGPPGPFLPPGTSPQSVVNRINTNADTAIASLIRLLGCNTKTGAARAACLARARALAALKARIDARFNTANGGLAGLSPEKQAALSRILAIHLQELQTLLNGQAARHTRCARPAFRNTLGCRNLATRDAGELLRLSILQLDELEGLLAA